MRSFAMSLFVSAWCFSSAQVLTGFKVYQLDGPPGALSYTPLNMSRDGRIVGFARLESGTYAYAGTPEGGYDFLPGLAWQPDSKCMGGSVTGQLAGQIFDVIGRPGAVSWSQDGTVTPIGIPDGQTQATGLGCDEVGNVVVRAGNGDPRTERPYRWSPTSGYQVLQPLAGTNAAWPSDMLPGGYIVGTSRQYLGQTAVEDRATRWNPNGGPELLPHPLTSSHSFALSGSSSETVVGYCQLSGRNRAVVWRATVPTLLDDGGLTSMARAVSPHGDVYGFTGLSAAFWRAPGWALSDMNTMIDPSTQGWTLQEVVAVGPDGRVFGTGTFHGVPGTPFIAVPVYGDDVFPAAATVNIGWLALGDYFSFSANDGDVFRVCKFTVPNLQVPPVQVTLSAFSPNATYTKLSLAAVSRAMVSGLFRQTLELYDFRRGDYDPTDVRTDPMTRQWRSDELEATGDIKRYIRTDRLVRARYSVRCIGPSSVPGWCVEHDQVKWHFE
ncbi:MAG: hypothetical protein JST30_14580 [Armatimonadetes bacterium]|nr:hypothetical protein [Armatimonadota bacterium]